MLQIKILKILGGFTLAWMLFSLWMIFAYAPTEKMMGAVQKVFYIHVSCLWVGMLGFLFAAVFSIAYLRTENILWDIYSLSAVEISLLFFFLGIASGSIWAKPIWNTWWTWDPRLTSAAVVELIYGAYLLLRQSIDFPKQRARISAVYALVGFVSVPLTFFSIRFLRTIHPVIIANSEGNIISVAPPMLLTLIVTIFSFSLLFILLLFLRVKLGKAQEELEELKAELYAL